ncbi:MAG TPA: hypothetical protein VFS07_10535 [Gemmatimonadales bacterium]|nr:hypothetical protein [Gemmatimonadales bacterium]
MGGALRRPGGGALKGIRATAAGIAALAVLLAVALAVRAHDALRRETDGRAARIAAGYLAFLAAPAPRRPPGDGRLLSAAGALAGASFWTGGLQVWLDGTPLLPADTTGHRAVAAPLPLLTDSAGRSRASVAAWGHLPSLGRPIGVALVTGMAGVVVALLLGRWAFSPRLRVYGGLVAVLLAGASVAELSHLLRKGANDAASAGLVRARRVVEVATVRRRLRAGEVEALLPGLVVAAAPRATLADTLVTAAGDSLVIAAVAGRGQAWRLTDPAPEAPLGAAPRAILWLALLAALGAAAAIPPWTHYFLIPAPRGPHPEPPRP